MPISSLQPPWLCLVRHGITAPQEERRYCGHSDPPLSARGVGQMRELRARLASALPLHAPVFSSDSLRAIESVAILTGSAPTLTLPELREINFGEWEGKRFEETGCDDPERLRDCDFRFPGGESVAMLRARVADGWRRIQERLIAQPALIVAHGGSLDALLLLLRRQPAGAIWNYHLPHGGVAWWRCDGTVSYE